MKWSSRWKQALMVAGSQERVAGQPPSANGASSLHLWWLLPDTGPFSQVSAVVEVTAAPSVARLYFWALQVSFVDRGRNLGAGHTGLQWHPAAPQGAVNWGGYATAGGELQGTQADLAHVDGPNTCHYRWSAGRPYLFRVSAAGLGAWRSEVTDLSTGTTTTIRDLLVPATGLASPVVWSEVFARCDDPPTEVRWSSLKAVDFTGRAHRATAVRPTYQSYADGGCTNTESRAGPGYFAQLTGLSAPRPSAPEVISLPGPTR
ncbi:MAG: hypothetical protein M1435_01040 [Actinobacteria bacterium]|nr:hypothetical protein [Actinomycetota bacterium]